MRKPFEIRFRSKVDKSGPTPDHRPDLGPCWLWTGAVNSGGYGVVSRDGRQEYAHRIALELDGNQVSSGKEVDHLCRMRRCVRQTHLEPVVRRVNILRGISFSATNAQKTHCPKGHPLSGKNLFISGSKRRRCLECHRKASCESMRRQWAKKRGAA